MVRTRLMLASFALLAVATPAWAHHPMGGKTPGTLLEGLLSGFGHPVIGLDHFAFVVGVGLLAALVGRGWSLPLASIAGTVGGTVLHLAALDLPVAEAVIVLSVAAIGGAIAWGARLAPALIGLSFAVFGLFHGYAYGESVVGAEATPLAAYLAGFSIIQYGIATAAGQVFQWASARAPSHALAGARIAGGVMIGIAVAIAHGSLGGALGAG